MTDLFIMTRRTFMKLIGAIIGILANMGLGSNILLGQPSNMFSKTVVHSTSDSDHGKSFVIPNFLTNCIIKEIRVKANYSSGQRSIWTVFIDDPNGIRPEDTNIQYRGIWDSSPVGEYAYIDNEMVYISADSGTVLTVARGVKGTVPSYYDYNTQIRIANNGLRLILYKDSNKKLVDNLKIMDRIMTWKGTTDIFILPNSRLIKFTDNIINVSKYDILYLNGIFPERAIAENINNSAKIISVSDSLSAHVINLEVQKQIVYNDLIPYSGEDNLYGILYIDEKIDDTIIIDIDILVCDYRINATV
jgi:hypothetical protein